jgi:hypothetical protein
MRFAFDEMPRPQGISRFQMLHWRHILMIMETSHQSDAALIEPSGGQCEGLDEHAALLVVWFVGRVELRR